MMKTKNFLSFNINYSDQNVTKSLLLDKKHLH